MAQGFSWRDAPGRVQNEESAKQVYSRSINCLSVFFLGVPTRLDHLRQVFGRLRIERQISRQRFALWPVRFDIGSAQGFENLAKLLDVRARREEVAVISEQFGHDAAGGPDIDALAIVAGITEEDLRRPIIPRHHVLGVPAAACCCAVKQLRNVEVDELDGAFGIEHQIVHFDISVPDADFMHLREPGQHLAHDIFDRFLGQEPWISGLRSLTAVPILLILR